MAEEIRIGKVSSVDYAAGLVRVVYHDKDDSVTAPMPMLANEYQMPKVGDQVVVLHLSNGAEAGVVLGRYWTNKNEPPGGKDGLYRKDLGKEPGEAMIRYEAGTITISAPAVVISGSLRITGDLYVSGKITAAAVTTSGDVVANGVSLIGHTHKESQGGTTEKPA